MTTSPTEATALDRLLDRCRQISQTGHAHGDIRITDYGMTVVIHDDQPVDAITETGDEVTAHTGSPIIAASAGRGANVQKIAEQMLRRLTNADVADVEYLHGLHLGDRVRLRFSAHQRIGTVVALTTDGTRAGVEWDHGAAYFHTADFLTRVDTEAAQ